MLPVDGEVWNRDVFQMAASILWLRQRGVSSPGSHAGDGWAESRHRLIGSRVAGLEHALPPLPARSTVRLFPSLPVWLEWVAVLSA